MHNFEALKQILSTPQKVVILPHRKPDADALGSSLGLSAYLKKLNHHVHVISPTDYPKFLFWMYGNEEVVVFENGEQQKSKKLIQEADVIFCLDFSSLNRIDKLGELVKDRVGKSKIVLIDHHIGKEDFADFELWDTKAAATAELIYDFIIMNNDKELIDDDIAACIYAGIMTDTGSFKFPSTSSKIHRIVAELKDTGLESSKIHNLVYDTNSESRVRFLGYALNKKLIVLPEYRTAYFAITMKELQMFNSQTGDTEGLVNYALSVEGIRFAALFIEKKDHVKISFRSVGDFSVADLASQYFQGGGHKNAAGGMLRTTLDKTVNLFKDILPKYQASLIQDQTSIKPE